MNIIGDVDGTRCILIDDIVDSGGTLVQRRRRAAGQGRHRGDPPISRTACSPGGAVAAITSSNLKALVITDSIQPTETVKSAANIRVISIAPLMAEAIGRTAREESVSSLFY